LSELERIKSADPTLSHKEAFKQAAANWQQGKSTSKGCPAESSAELGCLSAPIKDHQGLPARQAHSQDPAKMAAGMGSAVTDSDSADDSIDGDEENRRGQALRQSHSPKRGKTLAALD
jgi:hypothetical protein